MATLNNRRVTALLLKDNLNALYAEVLPLYALSSFWNASGSNEDLPAEGEVKTVMLAYETLAIRRITADTAIRDVKASSEEFEGMFTLPTTAFLVPFAFAGPVWSPLSQAQGFGVALTLQRLTVFVKHSGTAGDNLTIDLRVNDVSVLSTPVTIPINSGDNVGVIVPSFQIVTTAIPAESTLSAHILTAPDDAESVALNVWLKAADA